MRLPLFSAWPVATLILFWSAGVAQNRPIGLPEFEFPVVARPAETFRNRCPVPCDEAGPRGFTWSRLSGIQALDKCNETLLFQPLGPLAVGTPDWKDGAVWACSSPTGRQPESNDYGIPCLASVKLIETTVNVEVGWRQNDTKTVRSTALLNAIKELRKNLLEDPTCEPTAVFSQSGGRVAGLYVGAEVRKASAVALVDRVIDFVSPDKPGLLPAELVAQICGPKGERSAAHVFGVMYQAADGLDEVYAALQAWSKAECVSGLEETQTWKDQKLSIIPALAITMGADAMLDENPRAAANNLTWGRNSTPGANSTATWHKKRGHNVRIADSAGRSVNHLAIRAPWNVPRAQCSVVKVESGDSCWSIAIQRCNIKQDELYRYNGGSDSFCSKLKPGDYLCCSAGDKPSMDPTANADGTCKYVQVQEGDTCSSIADQRCRGLSLDQLYRFNGGINAFFFLCNNLKLRSVVCCSPGTKPDLRPQKNADGSCAVYAVRQDDSCFAIQEQLYLASGDLDKFNKGKTWGWAGCQQLVVGMHICTSDGDPPMPARLENAVCGPQVRGTQRPASGKKLADMNPCPLNACCNIWGMCGTTVDFCTDTTVDNTPGTAKKGTNGCVSNCGMSIVNNAKEPDQFQTIAYFEGWNFNRSCLNFDVTKVGAPYTTIHFAFGWITEDFQVNTKGVEEQFAKFKTMTGIKKVISYGGWTFSNDASTSHILHNAIRTENVVRFAQNVADFVVNNNLDGVDIDWEYPGATDIKNSQNGTAEDGPNYLRFLQMLRRRLPKDKTVSFAAPASYWYLRNFPMADIAKVTDYVVYMTYDLHGQWDYGNIWAADGCPNGNCLRSHINRTETENALVMITKAGVPSNKVVVGISSYGRSFKMEKAGCTGPGCLYLGAYDDSAAQPGYCTGTAGYLAEAEIRQIRKLGDSDLTEGYSYYEYYDEQSDTDVMVYNDVEWVGWMDTLTKKRRVDWYKSLNFGGVTDWAVDLQRDESDEDSDPTLGGLALDLSLYDCKMDTEYQSLDDLSKDADNLPEECLAMHATSVLKKSLDSSLTGYDDAANGYDGLFDYYREYIETTLNGRLIAFMKEKNSTGPDFFNCFAAEGEVATRRQASPVNCRDLPHAYKQSYSFFWELKDAAGFNKSLNTAGIDPEWVMLGVYEDVTRCVLTEQPGNCWDLVRRHVGFPVRGPAMVVPNPKEVVDKARANFTNLQEEYSLMYMEIGFGTWEGNLDEAVDVLSVPVFMLEDAVSLMKEVKEIGQKFKEYKEEELILKIVTGILMLIPFVGMGVGNLGRVGASIARLLMAADLGGNTALSIYTIIEDPEMAPGAIVMLLMSGLGLAAGGGAEKYRTLSLTKGRMTEDNVKSMGPSFKANNPKVRSLMGKICPK